MTDREAIACIVVLLFFSTIPLTVILAIIELIKYLTKRRKQK